MEQDERHDMSEDRTPDSSVPEENGEGAAEHSPPEQEGGSDGAPQKVVRTFGPASAVAWALLVLIIVGQALLVLWDFQPAIASTDANGYWAQGAVIANTGHTYVDPEKDAQYAGNLASRPDRCSHTRSDHRTG